MKSIGILAYEGCWSLNVSLVKDMFRILALLESHKELPPSYVARVLTMDGKKTISASGAIIAPDGQFDPTASYDVVVVPAMEGVRLFKQTSEHKAIIGALRALLIAKVPLLSLSTAAYFIAATGEANDTLLATHWAYIKKLKSLFPEANFTSHTSYLRDENIYSTSTLNAVIDVLLALIAEEKGERFAYELATHLLVSDPREIHPILPGYRNHNDNRIYAVQNWIETHYQGSCRIEVMARKFGFSERNLKRRFQLATGTSPNQYLQQVRMDKAKKLLLATQMTVKGIAYEVGYDNDSFFSRVFKRNTGATPTRWRDGD